MNLFDDKCDLFTLVTKWPEEIFYWLLASSTNTSSETHIDASGLATRVTPILGKKIWLIGIGDKLPVPVEGGLEWDDAFGKWQIAVLCPGDEL